MKKINKNVSLVLGFFIFIIINNFIYIPNANAQKISLERFEQITEDGFSRYPTWDPSGKKLYYVSFANGSKGTLMSYDFDKGKPLKINLTNPCLFPCISPDGTKIAYNTINDKQINGKYYLDLWYYDLSSKQSFSIIEYIEEYNSSLTDEFTRPFWNKHDGLIYYAQHLNEKEMVLWSTDIKGYNKQESTSGGLWDAYPAWNREGSKIAFVRANPSIPVGDICISNLGYTKTDQITHHINGIWAKELSWSPDGKYIVYTSNRYTKGFEDIWITSSDGEQQFILYGTENQEFYPSWSPDGDKIAYIKNINGNYDIFIAYLNYDKTAVYYNIPDKMTLNFENKIDIIIQNLNAVNNTYKININSNGFTNDIVKYISINSMNTNHISLLLIPNAIGNITSNIEIINKETLISETHPDILVELPSEISLEPNNTIIRNITQGEIINQKIHIKNVSNDMAAKNIELTTEGQLSSYMTLSKFYINHIEPNDENIIELSITIPDSDFSANKINGSIIVKGDNFMNTKADIKIQLLKKSIDPQIEAATKAANASREAATISASATHNASLNTAILGFIGAISGALIGAFITIKYKSSDAISILKLRLANGEITEEMFDETRKKLVKK
jgi:Tol biopolymer transport system component